HGGSDELRQRVDELRRDLEMVQRLEEIRIPDLASGTDSMADDIAAHARIAAAFRGDGIDLESLEPTEAGERGRARTSPRRLAAALEHWSRLRRAQPEEVRKASEPFRKRLLAVIRAADPDVWRSQVRDALEEGRTETLTRLAASATV